MKRVCENPIPVQEVRNHVKVIHIQCDEDHVALQQSHRRSIVKPVSYTHLDVYKRQVA